MHQTDRQNSDTWPIITPYTYSHTYTLQPACYSSALRTYYRIPLTLPYPYPYHEASNTVAVASIDSLWTQASSLH
jgi:hypothetical protein